MKQKKKRKQNSTCITVNIHKTTVYECMNDNSMILANILVASRCFSTTPGVTSPNVSILLSVLPKPRDSTLYDSKFFGTCPLRNR